MLPKILTATLFCFAAIQIILCLPKALRSREEDADAAFNEYLNASHQILIDLSAHIKSLELTLSEQLEEQQLNTVDLLNKKLDDVASRISQIVKNLESVGVEDTCTYGYPEGIEAQRLRLTSRAEKCKQLTADIISAYVSQTFSEMTETENNLMGCYGRSLGECRRLATDDSCYDFFIDNIAKATKAMVNDFELIKINFENKIVSLKLPCQDLIEFEISVYPDYNLQTINQCVDNSIRNGRSLVCPESSL